VCCWARAFSGHAAAAPPKSPINSRRLMPPPNDQIGQHNWLNSIPGRRSGRSKQISLEVTDVRFGSIASIPRCTRGVRSSPDSGHQLPAFEARGVIKGRQRPLPFQLKVNSAGPPSTERHLAPGLNAGPISRGVGRRVRTRPTGIIDTSNQSDRPADGVNRLLDDVPIASALPAESDRIAAISFGETQGNGRAKRSFNIRSMLFAFVGHAL
jgi:hypothetical protein